MKRKVEDLSKLTFVMKELKSNWREEVKGWQPKKRIKTIELKGVTNERRRTSR